MRQKRRQNAEVLPKPGTGPTLALSVAARNGRGNESPRRWHGLPLSSREVFPGTTAASTVLRRVAPCCAVNRDMASWGDQGIKLTGRPISATWGARMNLVTREPAVYCVVYQPGRPLCQRWRRNHYFPCLVLWLWGFSQETGGGSCMGLSPRKGILGSVRLVEPNSR